RNLFRLSGSGEKRGDVAPHRPHRPHPRRRGFPPPLPRWPHGLRSVASQCRGGAAHCRGGGESGDFGIPAIRGGMSDFVFSLPQPFIAIQGSAKRFPVRRVWCVGRNYAAHAKELGNDAKDPPFFFSKQPDMIVPGGGALRYPGLTSNYHYECELVVALKEGGENVSVMEAPKLVFGHAVGLDMTRRDL